MNGADAQRGDALVVGASGGIGNALMAALSSDGRFGRVHGWSRHARTTASGIADRVDITAEAEIAAAAARLRDPLRLVVVATGILHGAALTPEKTYKAVEAGALLHAFHVNTVGPALLAKHLLPRLASPGRSVFAVLSARVGSIGDNRSGGWHAYRASKAALNMLLRGIAVELARTRPETLIVGLHPGTVDTALSRPFQRGVPPGRLFTPDHAARRLLAVIDALTPSESGCVLAHDGSIVPP